MLDPLSSPRANQNQSGRRSASADRLHLHVHRPRRQNAFPAADMDAAGRTAGFSAVRLRHCRRRGDDQTSTTVYHPRGGAGAGQSAALRRGSGAHEQRDVCRPVCAAPASRALYLLYKELGNAQHSAAAASGVFAAAVHPRKEVHSGSC